MSPDRTDAGGTSDRGTDGRKDACGRENTMAPEKSLLVTCPACRLEAQIMPLKTRIEEGGKGKCKHRQNALNCATLKAAIDAASKQRP